MPLFIPWVYQVLRSVVNWVWNFCIHPCFYLLLSLLCSSPKWGSVGTEDFTMAYTKSNVFIMLYFFFFVNLNKDSMFWGGVCATWCVCFFFKATANWIDLYHCVLSMFAIEQRKVLAVEMSIEVLQTGTKLAKSKHCVESIYSRATDTGLEVNNEMESWGCTSSKRKI